MKRLVERRSARFSPPLSRPRRYGMADSASNTLLLLFVDARSLDSGSPERCKLHVRLCLSHGAYLRVGRRIRQSQCPGAQHRPWHHGAPTAIMARRDLRTIDLIS